MLLNLFLRYLMGYLLIAIVILCAVIWLAHEMITFDRRSYSCHEFIDAFFVQQYQNIELIGTSHFTAGNLKVLNPPISLLFKTTLMGFHIYMACRMYNYGSELKC